MSRNRITSKTTIDLPLLNRMQANYRLHAHDAANSGNKKLLTFYRGAISTIESLKVKLGGGRYATKILLRESFKQN